MGVDVAVTLPDVPVEVDAAEMLRACAAKVDDGTPLADLHRAYVHEILTRLASALDDTVRDKPARRSPR
jgi:hypothetical protein